VVVENPVPDADGLDRLSIYDIVLDEKCRSFVEAPGFAWRQPSLRTALKKRINL
jgi:hypothetical protein